jgi:hypothetical protein
VNELASAGQKYCEGDQDIGTLGHWENKGNFHHGGTEKGGGLPQTHADERGPGKKAKAFHH